MAAVVPEAGKQVPRFARNDRKNGKGKGKSNCRCNGDGSALQKKSPPLRCEMASEGRNRGLPFGWKALGSGFDDGAVFYLDGVEEGHGFA